MGTLFDLFIETSDKNYREDGYIVHPRKFISDFNKLVCKINSSRNEKDFILIEILGNSSNRKYRITDKLNFRSSIVCDIDGLFDFYNIYNFINFYNIDYFNSK